jgi:hypothetical protein
VLTILNTTIAKFKEISTSVPLVLAKMLKIYAHFHCSATIIAFGKAVGDLEWRYSF